MYATGIGQGELVCDIGPGTPQRVKIKEVLYVPALDSSLLSVSKLSMKGIDVIFHKDLCRIMHDNKLVATGDLCTSGIFQLRQHRSNTALKTSEVLPKTKCSSDCVHGWHARLGHRDPMTILQVANNQLAEGIQIKACGIKKCETCVQGKMTKLPFPSKASPQAREILDLVHSDVSGPMEVQTPNQMKYVVTFIDDYSRYTVIYLLKRKSEVEEKVKEYVKMVKTKFGRVPKKIRSDNGGEYSGKSLKDFLISEGIKQEFTAPYTPQQNGVAERKNRSLVEMTRCMLVDSSLDKKYWGEAIHTANHLQNRLPTKGSDVIPYTRWHNKIPDYSYLRTFGTTAYSHCPKELRKKLDNKARKLVFVGYKDGSKAYRLLDVNNDRVTITRDVQFIEDSHESLNAKPSKSLTEDNPTVEDEGQIELPEEEPNHPVEDNDNQLVVPRRSCRPTKGKPPERLIETVNLSKEDGVEPKTWKEAQTGPHASHWNNAMNNEIQSLKTNGTWQLTKLPDGANIIGSKWVFKEKQNENGEIVTFRARLVAQGYSQKYGHDYDQVFAPVVTQTTLKLLLTIAGKRQMFVRH